MWKELRAQLPELSAKLASPAAFEAQPWWERPVAVLLASR